MNLTVTNDGDPALTATVTVTGATPSTFVRAWRSDPSGVALFEDFNIFSTAPSFTATFEASTPGLYYFFGLDATGTPSTLVPCIIDDGSDPVQTRFRAAVKARIESLGLGLNGGVVPQWTPDKVNIDFPCVVLTHEGTTETNNQLVVGTSDIGRPIRVMICDRTDLRDHAKMPTYDRWRQRIWRAFGNQRIPGLAENTITVVEPDVISNPNTPMYQFMVSELIVRATCREPSTGV